METFLVALRLGLTSFGGPIAHLAYFRDEYVVRRRWLDEATYAELVALCQSIPGPTSSEVGIAIGLIRSGPLGAFLAWLGFTLPSAVALVVIATFLDRFADQAAGVIHGLGVVTVAIVAFAVWGMARALRWDPVRVAIGAVAVVLVLGLPGAPAQIAVIAAAGVAGWLLLRGGPLHTGAALDLRIGRRAALACAALYTALLALLPLARVTFASGELALLDSFYRAGGLVFGGGHVVLPLLQAEVVPPGWVTEERFLAGYGATQAMPGPLFTFAAYLGSVITPFADSQPGRMLDLFTPWPPHGVVGATIALLAIFLPAFLLVFAAVPWWSVLRGHADAQGALRGINAAVVGILLAALITPVASSAIRAPSDAALALAGLAMLFAKLPAWSVVLTVAAIASLLR